MTSATVRHYGAAGRHAEGRGLGMVIFAGVLLAVIGFFNLLDGIAAIANSTFFIGGVQLLAAVGVWAGSQLARWFAVAVVALNAIAQMFFIPAYPFWSLVIIAVDVVALWGLCMYGSRENLGVA